MIFPSFSQSHHCTNTTLSVLALCNNEIQSTHLLAVGSDLGTVDLVNLEDRTSIASFNNLHDTQVLDLAFFSRDHILSYDKFSLIHLDIEYENRTVIYDNEESILSMSLLSNSPGSIKVGGSTPILCSTSNSILNFDLRLPNPITLINDLNNRITEICLLPDEHTLFGIDQNALSMIDIRRPDQFVSLGINTQFTKLSTNGRYLAAVTTDSQLYSFELPLFPLLSKSLFSYSNPFISRPSFCNDNIVIGNDTGLIFILDPTSDQFEFIQAPLETPIISIASSEAEISISFEDDIYVFSMFPFEDNLIRPFEDDSDDDFFNEENEPNPDWLNQIEEVVLEEGECSYERYGYCEQQVYVCFTCSHDSNQPIGVCKQCSLICHDGHDVRPIGSRRRFRCDCGNNKCPQFCKTMFAPKVSENTLNNYNHNFQLRWCICDGLDEPPMVQCICCDDWFHHECIGFYSDKRCLILDEIKCLNDWVFVCHGCLQSRLSFLDVFPDADPPSEIADFVLEMQKDFAITPYTTRKNHQNPPIDELNTQNSNQNSEMIKKLNITEEIHNLNDQIESNEQTTQLEFIDKSKELTHNESKELNRNELKLNNDSINVNETIEEFEDKLMRDGLGFTIPGGKWMPKDLLFKFKGKPEFDEEFDKIDPTEEDLQLKTSTRQREIGSFMKKAYTELFQRVIEDGRTVIQKSDADAVLSKNAQNLLIQRRRERDHDLD